MSGPDTTETPAVPDTQIEPIPASSPAPVSTPASRRAGTDPGDDGPASTRGAARPRSSTREGGARVAAVLGVLAVAASYFPEFRRLADIWESDPNYSHGFLIVPVAVLIYWRRRDLTGNGPNRPWHFAWPILLMVLAARAYLYETGSVGAETFTLLPALACLALTFGGWGQFRRAWPAIALLAFMLPLPARINGMLAGPLQGLATRGSTALLKMTGLWVIAEGNVIYVNKHPLEVAEACNGLSMLMCLAATVVAAVLLVPMSPWKRVVAVLSAGPIALACNILRITATAWCYQIYGAQVGQEYAHSAAGWLMMPTALVLIGLELLVLSWLVVEEEVVVEPMLLGNTISRRRSGSGSTAPALPPSEDHLEGTDLSTVLPPVPGPAERTTDG